MDTCVFHLKNTTFPFHFASSLHKMSWSSSIYRLESIGPYIKAILPLPLKTNAAQIMTNTPLLCRLEKYLSSLRRSCQYDWNPSGPSRFHFFYHWTQQHSIMWIRSCVLVPTSSVWIYERQVVKVSYSFSWISCWLSFLKPPDSPSCHREL